MTTTKTETIQEVLETANLNQLADGLKKIDFAKMLATVKAAMTGLAAAAAFDITTAAVKAAAIVGGIVLESGENLPPIGAVVSLRVTASGTANSVGTYAVGDAGSTPVSPTAGANVGLATLSDDGKTLTFPTTVTAFVLQYQPRAAAALTTKFAPSA